MASRYRHHDLLKQAIRVLAVAAVATLSSALLSSLLPTTACAGSVSDPVQWASPDDNDLPWDLFYPAIVIRKPARPRLLAPSNQYHIGDSIGEGEAADNTIGEPHHDKVWSTGYGATDIVRSLNERFEEMDPAGYSENNRTMDSIYNKAISGAAMADFASQAGNVAAEAAAKGAAGMVTILLGNNDVCAESLDGMTAPALFEARFRAGLDVLAASDTTKNAAIHVSGIPAIYWLWVAKKDMADCRLVWWAGTVCQSLLKDPVDDCASVASRDDPEHIHAGDGSNCQRRKEFHRRIRDIYNPILKNVIEEYKTSRIMPNIYFLDIFDVRFTSLHVNDGDCFHPSIAGHKMLADEEWCRSNWGNKDPRCSP